MKINAKRFFALIGVILLAGMIIATLIVAILGYTFEDVLFRALIIADVALPIFIWVCTWLFGRITGEENFTDKKTTKKSE